MIGTPVVVYKKHSTHKLVALISLICLGFMFMGFALGISVVHSSDAKLQSTTSIIIPLVLKEPTTPITEITQSEIVDDEVEEKIVAYDWNPKSFEDEIECMAKNIYFESRNEDIVGQIAVGLATINRVKDPAFPDTICEVVWEKRKHKITGRWVAQFSWTWDGKKDTPLEEKHWEESLTLAGAMLAEGSLDNFVDITNGAEHYHATYVKPYWRKKLRMVFVNGLHIFYSKKVTHNL
jgi:spore germination cell wall hydrolase CwlJ-like protein